MLDIYNTYGFKPFCVFCTRSQIQKTFRILVLPKLISPTMSATCLAYDCEGAHVPKPQNLLED